MFRRAGASLPRVLTLPLLRQRPLLRLQQLLGVRRFSSAEDGLYCASPIPRRTVLRVEGPDSESYLQGLITQDIRLLTKQRRPSIYTAFLNVQGRVIADAIIMKHLVSPNTFLIEIDASQREELTKHFNRYKVRTKSELTDASGVYTPYSVFGRSKHSLEALFMSSLPPATGCHHSVDPRIDCLGWRVFLDKERSGTPTN